MDLERAGAPPTARLLPIVGRCLRDAGLTPADVDDVLLVGSASRMPAVVRLAADAFGRVPDRTPDPDRVLALGAAVQAARARSARTRDAPTTRVSARRRRLPRRRRARRSRRR